MSIYFHIADDFQFYLKALSLKVARVYSSGLQLCKQSSTNIIHTKKEQHVLKKLGQKSLTNVL